MTEKTDAQVVIGGRTYTLSGYESEDMRQLLLNLNIADDYFKAEARIEELQGIIDKKENDLYDIKHELVAAQMKLQSADKKKK